MTVVNAEIAISTEMLRMMLDLPPEYQIMAAATEAFEVGSVIRVLVHAKSLPPINPLAKRHILMPHFRRVSTGQAELERVDIALSPSLAMAIEVKP